MANHAPFKKSGANSVKAHGKVSGVEVHRDGKHATVTVRHEAPKAKKPSQGGVYGMEANPEMPQETRATMPAAHAKLFPAGSKVAVHIGPPGEMPGADVGDSEAEGGEVGGADENESGAEADSENEDEEAVGAKGPKQAGGKGTKPKPTKQPKKESPIAAAMKKGVKK
jgi:hypothetical protein